VTGLVTSAVRRMWRGEAGALTMALAAATVPLASVFGTLVGLRNWGFDRGLRRSAVGTIPVISIGNLAVGGTGKTPTAGWLVSELRARGWRPAIVMRGYGDDEILLHRRWNPEVPVIRSPRRMEGILRAERDGADIVVLDDGFQHRSVHRDVDVVLLSPAHGARTRLLPRGPFREPLRALRRADIVLVTAKADEERCGARQLASEVGFLPGMPPVAVFPFRHGSWLALDGTPTPPPAGVPLVVTSVAEPEAFVRAVRDREGGVAGHLPFRDHHPFRAADAAEIHETAAGGWVATTEKDAVKLEPFLELLPEVRVLPLVADPPEGLADLILKGLPRTVARP